MNQKAIDSFLDQNITAKAYQRTPLTGDASFRRYERVNILNGKSYILMIAPPEKEPLKPFMFVDAYLVKHGFSAPRMIACDEAKGLLLLEDLGDKTFNSVLQKSPDKEEELYTRAVDVLINLHSHPAPSLPQHKDRALTETRRMSEWYFELIKLPNKHQRTLELDELWHHIISHISDDNVTCLFDYHADNLMWLPRRIAHRQVGLLDFQDAVIGSRALDLAALLQDIRRTVSPEIVTKMLEYYVQNSGVERRSFLTQYALMGAQWNTRILGTFARLGLRDKKLKYLQWLPIVWQRLESNLGTPQLQPYKYWLDQNFPKEHRYDIPNIS